MEIGRSRRQRLWISSAALALVASVVILIATLSSGGSHVNADKRKSQTTHKTTTTIHKEVVPAEWRTIHYDKLKNTPKGYFGPQSPCIKSGLNVKTCKNDLKTALKHDPMELSVWMEQFNLLPGQKDKMTPAQLEALRKPYAAKLEDWHLRKQQQPRVAAVIDSLRNSKVVRLSGTYYSTYTDGNGNVKPIQKVMNPAKNIALEGDMPDGTHVSDKLDCHHQPVSKTPIKPTPPPTTPPTTTVTTTTTLPPVARCPHGEVVPPNGLCPKHPEDDPMHNPKVPKKVKGPGSTPVGKSPGPPQKPVDTPTGCDPACTPPTQPGVTTTTVSHPTPSTIPTTGTDPPNTIPVTPVTAPDSA